MKIEEPNAVTVEVLNEKIDTLIKNQSVIQKNIDKSFRIIMKRINIIQDFNEIADMRAVVTNKELNFIKNKI